MPKKSNPLAGRWQKQPGGACGAVYPDSIEFQPNGLFFTQNQPARFSQWDVGRYEITGAAEVKLSTANDAEIRYALKLQAGVATFTDPEGCAVSYRKLPDV